MYVAASEFIADKFCGERKRVCFLKNLFYVWFKYTEDLVVKRLCETVIKLFLYLVLLQIIHYILYRQIFLYFSKNSLVLFEEVLKNCRSYFAEYYNANALSVYLFHQSPYVDTRYGMLKLPLSIIKLLFKGQYNSFCKVKNVNRTKIGMWTEKWNVFHH